MGRNYFQDIEQIEDTYDWAMNLPIERVQEFIEASITQPLIACGSGGSLTAAHLAVLLHQECGQISKAVSPYDILTTNSVTRESSVMVFSAGGRNKDILSAFGSVVYQEPRNLIALCLRNNTPLRRLALSYHFSSACEFDLPRGKDGFLATNSLLAFTVLTIRAYSDFLLNPVTLPTRMRNISNLLDDLGSMSICKFQKKNWVILYGAWAFPAAVDLESKFSESGLGTAQLVDYRNFAHGRHTSLQRNRRDTVIVALATPSEYQMAEATLQVIPEDFLKIKLYSQEQGASGALDLLLNIFCIIYVVARAQGVDPGRPHVPPFGRRLYHLTPRVRADRRMSPNSKKDMEAVAILRKSKASNLTQLSSNEIRYWQKHFLAFVGRIEKAEFSAIIFDYDGTLCDRSERYEGISSDIVRSLRPLLNSNILIGIATGRGRSVRDDLRKKFAKRYWDDFIIAYYNGASICGLGESEVTNSPRELIPPLKQLEELIRKNADLCSGIKIDCRPEQISIIPINRRSWNRHRLTLLGLASTQFESPVKVLESDHSIDIVPNYVSKLNLLSACERELKKRQVNGQILCIGDKGEWPGNDFELLGSSYSLSVDSVSGQTDSCWNLGSPGYRGTQSTIFYLSHTEPIPSGKFRMTLTRRKRNEFSRT